MLQDRPVLEIAAVPLSTTLYGRPDCVAFARSAYSVQLFTEQVYDPCNRLK